MAGLVAVTATAAATHLSEVGRPLQHSIWCMLHCKTMLHCKPGSPPHA